MDPHKLTAFLRAYEFRSLVQELARLPGQATARPEPARVLKEDGQPSLLSLAAPEPPQAQPLPGPEALPSLAGREAGLFLDQGTLHLAAGAKEWTLAADQAAPSEALTTSLARAARIFTPGLKELLRSGDGWDRIPLAVWSDLSLAAYLLNPEERTYDYEHLTRRFGPELTAPPERPGLFCLELGRALDAKTSRAGLDVLLREVEMPLVPVLAAMERRGVLIDRTAFAAFLDEVTVELDRLTREIHAAAGRDFNLRSSQQMAEVLFDELGLKPSGKTPGGAASTSQEVLEKLAGRHPVVELILEYRKLEKLRSTYLEPLPKLVDEEGRLHTTFHQMATATGRLSSAGPNLQNIPIRGGMGARMRACFTAAPGRRLVAGDYSQIELRVLAHLSEEPTLLTAFRAGEDIHARTAGLLLDKPPDSVTPDERRAAKTVNFGLIYGMGPQKLAQELHTSLKEAKEFIERYFTRLAALKTFYERVEQEAEATGYVTTMAGRRRMLPDILSRNQQLKAQARRQAVNTLIQGSAADLIKLAMLRADQDKTLQALDARLILQVHDELVLEAPKDAASQAGGRLAEIMAGVADLRAPLVVDWGQGATWAEAH